MSETEKAIFSYSLKDLKSSKDLSNCFSEEELNKVKNLARKNLSEKRFIHTENVGKMLYKLDENLGQRTSALLGYFHDITKDYPKEKQIEIINNSREMLYLGEESNPELFHGISASILFKEMFPKVPLICSLAIRHHSILSYDIRHDLIYNLYVSDKIEEGRTYISDDFRNFIITLASAEERAFEVMKMEKKDLEEKGKAFLPTTEKLFEELLKKHVDKN